MNEKPQDKNPVTSPYVGLMPFTEKEAVYFFGRTADQEVVATNLRAARLTIFYGASGVGKSSLLNAGVLPYLRRIATASILPDEPPEFILVVHREWANNPIDSLRLRIKDAVEIAVKEGKIPHLKPEDVETTARANEQNCNLSELLKNWTELIKTSLVIILDQFEDFFLHPEFMTGEGSFGEEFPKAVNNKELHVNYMISLRDDALSKLDFFKGKIQDPMKNTLRLLHLDRAATAEAICKPLEKYNEISGDSFTIDKKLVEKLVDDLQVDKVKFDTQGQAAVNVVDTMKGEAQTVSNGYRVETPYLQLVMERLWKDEGTQHDKHLTLDTLEQKFGGVQKIVETHLDEVMNQFQDEDKELASEFIHFTVTRSGAKIPWDVNDLADFAELPDRKLDIERILKRLCTGESRIFKAVPNRRNPQSPFYEVSHDALGPAILSWRKRVNDVKLQKLALQEAEEKRRIELAEIEKARQEELEEERKHKEEQARKLQAEQERRENQERLLAAERKTRKLGRIIYVGAISLIIVLGAAGGWIYKYFRDKNESRRASIIQDYEEEVKRYKSLIDILVNLHSGKRGSVNIALSQLEQRAKDNELPKEYKPLFKTALENTRAVYPDIAKKLEETRIAVDNSDAKIQEHTDKSPTIVYIHVPQLDPNAEKVRNLLKENDYVAPSIEQVGSRGNVKNPQIRYFRKTDDVMAIAEEIRQFLAQHKIEAELVFIGGFEDSPLVRPRQFELWFTGEQIANIK
jgi:flagellar basal body-associated protein FliL/DNA-binding cell septation regulator SpoVG